MGQKKPRSPITLARLAKALKMPCPKLGSFVNYRKLPKTILDGWVAIDRSYALQILKWTRSCGIAQAVCDLHVRFTTAKTFLEQGRLQGEVLFGKMRIFLQSIENLKKEGVYDNSVIFPERRGFARFSEERLREINQAGRAAEIKIGRLGHRWTREEAELAREKRWGVRRRQLKLEAKKQRCGTRRLMTLNQAAKFLGTSVSHIRELADNFTLRRFDDGEEILLYASSVEAYQKIQACERVFRERGGERRGRPRQDWSRLKA